jgi:hypothetical protein
MSAITAKQRTICGLPALPPELIHSVVYAVPWNERKTLAVLARTCRTSSDAALDRLWSRLPHMILLALTMPECHWHLEEEIKQYGPHPRMKIVSRFLSFKPCNLESTVLPDHDQY